MAQIKVALLQKPGSPLTGSLAPILAGCEVAALAPDPEAALPPQVASGERLVLWDLHGFSAGERREWQTRLEAEEVGVVLAAPPGLAGLTALATACGALALITPSQGAPQSRLQLAAASAMQGRIQQLLSQASDLEAKLVQREVIEKAKNLLVLSMGLSEPEALRRMQQHARRTNQKLIEVAHKVLGTYRLFNGDPK